MFPPISLSLSPTSSSPLPFLSPSLPKRHHPFLPLNFSLSPSSSPSDRPLPPSVITFWQWLREEGIISSTTPVKPAYVPEGLGLVATRDISDGEIILRVPRRLWVNPDNVASSEIGYLSTNLKPWVSVALFLIREKLRGSSSSWSFYIDTLPQITDSTLFWSEEELQEIKGTLLLRMTVEMKRHVQDEFRKVEEEIISHYPHLFPSSLTFDGFLWAFGMLRSRAFSRISGQLAMIPLIDLINHSDIVTVEDNAEEINGPAGLFSWDLLFCLKSTLPVKEGEQVFIQYGLKKSNADLALYYGFVESSTDRDSYTLEFSISETDPFFKDKLEIAKSNDLEGTGYFNIFMDCTFPSQMLPYLRLIALQETDAFLLESTFRDSIWGTLEHPITRSHEELVCRMVRDFCKSALSGYHTSIEEDERLIEGGNLDYKRMIAVRVRAGEKRVLQKIKKNFKDRESGLDELEYYHDRRFKELGLVGEGDEVHCQPQKDSLASI